MRRKDVDARKCQCLHLLCMPHQFSLASFCLRVPASSTTAKVTILVEEQIARSLAVLNCNGGQGGLLRMKPHHPPQIDVADHIHVVQNEGLLQALAGLEKERSGFLQAPASVKQDVFA